MTYQARTCKIVITSLMAPILKFKIAMKSNLPLKKLLKTIKRLMRAKGSKRWLLIIQPKFYTSFIRKKKNNFQETILAA